MNKLQVFRRGGSAGIFLLASLLAGCASGAGAGPSAELCGSITQTGGCTARVVATQPTNEPVFKAKAITTYAASAGSQQVTESFRATGATESFTSEVSGASSSRVAVTYNPANDQFTVKVNQAGAGVSTIYDDPLYRTAFGGARFPQQDVPELADYLYLTKVIQSGSTETRETFFYQTPGSRTTYVSLAGFVRQVRVQEAADPRTIRGTYSRLQTAMAVGLPSPASRVPASGEATFSGDFLATAVYNTDFDVAATRSRLDWIRGSASISVNFAQGALTSQFTGAFVEPAQRVTFTTPVEQYVQYGGFNASNAGVSFVATASSNLTSDRSAFTGVITSASVGGASLPVAASSVQGSFYGPSAQELGGAFRLQGGGPDQRVEVMGAFTGAR